MSTFQGLLNTRSRFQYICIYLVQVEHGDLGHLPSRAAGSCGAVEVHLEQVGVGGLGYHAYTQDKLNLKMCNSNCVYLLASVLCGME